jgi:hypothetical protein
MIVNTRAAYYFVLSLVSPRELSPTPQAAPAPETSRPAPSGYTVRVGPIVATVAPTSIEPGIDDADDADGAGAATGTAVTAAAPTAPSQGGGSRVAVPSGAPARIGATIGALERLLIVAFMLTGAEAAVGFVIAAKTIARFKQLDDRGFAEYYLLGTLASVAVAISTSLVALAALGTLS